MKNSKTSPGARHACLFKIIARDRRAWIRRGECPGRPPPREHCGRGEYASMFDTAEGQAQAANASVRVFPEVSTANGTAAQTASAAPSISPDGYYVAAAGNIPQTDQFFQLMKAAGY